MQNAILYVTATRLTDNDAHPLYGKQPDFTPVILVDICEPVDYLIKTAGR